MTVGHGFGRTRMGVEQIGARENFVCCGDPGDCNGPCRDEPAGVCICDPDWLELDIPDVRCPQHGLVAFAKTTLVADRGSVSGRFRFIGLVVVPLLVWFLILAVVWLVFS